MPMGPDLCCTLQFPNKDLINSEETFPHRPWQAGLASFHRPVVPYSLSRVCLCNLHPSSPYIVIQSYLGEIVLDDFFYNSWFPDTGGLKSTAPIQVFGDPYCLPPSNIKTMYYFYLPLLSIYTGKSSWRGDTWGEVLCYFQLFGPVSGTQVSFTVYK